MLQSFNIIFHQQWLQVHLTKQLSFDGKCYFLTTTHRNKNVISKFQLNNIKIQMPHSFADHLVKTYENPLIME